MSLSPVPPLTSFHLELWRAKNTNWLPPLTTYSTVPSIKNSSTRGWGVRLVLRSLADGAVWNAGVQPCSWQGRMDGNRVHAVLLGVRTRWRHTLTWRPISRGRGSSWDLGKNIPLPKYGVTMFFHWLHNKRQCLRWIVGKSTACILVSARLNVDFNKII